MLKTCFLVFLNSLVGVDKFIQFKTTVGNQVASTTAESLPKPLPPQTQNPLTAIMPRSLGRVNVSPMSKASRATAATTTKSTAMTKTTATMNTNQSSLSQYFKKVGNAHAQPSKPVAKEAITDLAKREPSPMPIQNVAVRSPSLFSTPSSNTLSPVIDFDELYDINEMVDTPESENINLPLQANYDQNDKENNELISPPLVQTPIQSKINAARRQTDGGVNGFVCAKSICQKDIPTIQPPEHLKAAQAVNNATIAKQVGVESKTKEIPEMEDCDDAFLNMVFDEQNIIEISLPSTKSTGPSTVVGLANANYRNRAMNDSILKTLNLNANSCKSSKTIVNDFDDAKVDSDDEHFTAPNVMLTEKHLAFFSPKTIAHDDNETCAMAHTSPTIHAIPRAFPSPPPPRPLPSNNGLQKNPPQNMNKNVMPSSINHHFQHRSIMDDFAYRSKTNVNLQQRMPSNRPGNFRDSQTIGGPSKSTIGSSELSRQQQQHQQQPEPTKRPAPSNFNYVPPPQMQSIPNRSQYQQQHHQQEKTNFFAADTPEPKRRKVVMEHVLSSAGNKYAEKLAK